MRQVHPTVSTGWDVGSSSSGRISGRMQTVGWKRYHRHRKDKGEENHRQEQESGSKYSGRRCLASHLRDRNAIPIL